MRYHDCTLGNGPKHASGQLVYKVTEGVVVLFLALCILNRKLKLALNLPHKEVIDHHIVGWVIQFVPDPHYFKFALHILAVIQNVYRFQKSDKSALTALVL